MGEPDDKQSPEPDPGPGPGYITIGVAGHARTSVEPSVTCSFASMLYVPLDAMHVVVLRGVTQRLARISTDVAPLAFVCSLARHVVIYYNSWWPFLRKIFVVIWASGIVGMNTM